MTARDVAWALAGRRAQRLSDGSYLVPCPLPSHGKGRGDRNPSLRIGDGASRLLVHCYAGCDARDVLDALRRRGLLDGAPSPVPSEPPIDGKPGGRREGDEAARKADRIRRAREIWRIACDPRGTPAEMYLGFRRLALDDELAEVLRFHPRCPWRLEFVPALIADFRSLDDDAITGIHRIRLDQPQRWPRAERRMLGVVHRAAVKLDGDVGDVLAIGEGVETCMAARQLMATGELERAPVWALGSAGGIACFPVLPGIRTLRLIGENDRASEQAIEQCGERWTTAGRRVREIKPLPDCKDLNDLLGREVP